MKSSQTQPPKQAGYTLIELLIATSVSVLIMLLSSGVMSGMLEGMSRSQKQGLRWDEIRQFTQRLSADLSSISTASASKKGPCYSLSQSKSNFLLTLHSADSSSDTSIIYEWSENDRKLTRRQVSTNKKQPPSSVDVLQNIAFIKATESYSGVVSSANTDKRSLPTALVFTIDHLAHQTIELSKQTPRRRVECVVPFCSSYAW